MSLTQTDKEYFEGLIGKIALKTATSTHFKESCDKHWNKKACDLGDVTTGEDLSTTAGKANVRKAYDYVKGQMDKSNLISKTVIVEIVKLVVVAGVVIYGMKAGM